MAVGQAAGTAAALAALHPGPRCDVRTVNIAALRELLTQAGACLS